MLRPWLDRGVAFGLGVSLPVLVWLNLDQAKPEAVTSSQRSFRVAPETEDEVVNQIESRVMAKVERLIEARFEQWEKRKSENSPEAVHIPIKPPNTHTQSS